ncbi:capsular polysaccharide export protein, LipB/KpsS family [Roseobacter sp. CCS2]|uniref:capsular polysaccharide export protein, LipB/KpsS family n=1 Tax=Roseobacter sp. CCS2 TaxID=391593 RepID=UPI0000F4019C|nr:hypothetical protein [Roseobacter sp. CCS2]EBA14120.1 hypothetical protein RCCS2_09524 [Roseobacter sp. CCS2]
MSARNTVTFYLPPQLRKQAERGNHNFINKVSDVLTGAGLTVAFDGDDDLARLRALARSGRGLYLMDPPVNARGLTFRKTYIYPFWHIEKQAERWDWPVAQDTFDPFRIDARKATNFARLWRRRLFDDAPDFARQDGFVYVPLQGQLLRSRSFQSCSPLEMVKAVLAHDTKRHVVVTLHPSETYAVEEQKALETLASEDDRLIINAAGSPRYLQNCDYVVTQNSAVGFEGYFFGKPLILFAKSDFHHIALNAGDLGAEQAFLMVQDHAPDYTKYLYWFLQLRAINAGRPEAKKRIAASLRFHGWPV